MATTWDPAELKGEVTETELESVDPTEPVGVAYRVNEEPRRLNYGRFVDDELECKTKNFNAKIPADRRADLTTLKAVYRRGVMTFSSADMTTTTRHNWAMTRVDAFLRLLSAGKPANSAYTADFDLLPDGHPKARRREGTLVAAITSGETASATLKPASEYSSPEEAILALTEFSGLGYEAEYAVRASWLRAVRNGEDPFKRASMLATMTYDSLDADLLPKREAVQQ